MERASVCCFITDTIFNTLFVLNIRRKQTKNQFTEKLVYLHFIFILVQYSDKFMHSIVLFSIVLRRS